MTMTRKGPSPFVALVLVTALIVCSQLVPRAEAQAECNVTQLIPCAPALYPPKPAPTEECCTKLNEEQPCFCDYMRDPRYRNIARSPRAKDILQYCNVPYPDC